MSRKLQVLVVFEFDGIESPDSEDADAVIDELTHEIKNVVRGDWQSPITSATAWVQDATMIEEF
jgi:hypothetical protein